MAFLGIDQSLRAPGLCLLSEEGRVLFMATLDPGKRRDGERLAFIRDAVRERLVGVRVVAMEGYSYNSVNKPFLLGEVGGVIKMAVFDAGVKLHVVAPQALKKFATSDHTASKEKVISRAQQLGADPEDDNQADAFFLARVAWMAERDLQGAFAVGANRSQLDVLQNLKIEKNKTKKRVRRLVKNSF